MLVVETGDSVVLAVGDILRTDFYTSAQVSLQFDQAYRNRMTIAYSA